MAYFYSTKYHILPCFVHGEIRCAIAGDQVMGMRQYVANCQKVLLRSINGHLRSSLFYDYLLVSDVLDINDLLDTRSLGMYSACMAPHFPALLCSVYRHCSFPVVIHRIVSVRL